MTSSWDGALTANAYLGGFGIAAALTAGADVVVTGRVTDASLVVGPAVAHHGWSATSYDELAGAVVAGHVIECGTQATGGNFSGFLDLPHRDRPLGFPVAEVAADGSSVITKHAGTGGAVTVDTVTAQLVYEIQSTRYLGPDVTVHLDTVRLEQAGEDRVAIGPVVGEAPPERLKVCVNELGGWRNSVELVLTGLDVEAKAEWVREQLGSRLTAAEVVWSDVAAPPADADSEESASTLLRCTVKDPSPDPVGRAFTAAAVELALGSYPGFTMTAPPAPATPFGIYRAAYVDRADVTHTVVHADGRREVVADPGSYAPPGEAPGARPSPYPGRTDVLTRRLPLGTFVHARSGDKGGDANVGLWVAHDGVDRRDVRRPRAVALQADVAARHPGAAAGGGRPRRRRVAAAPPRRGQRRHPRPPRRGCRGLAALRPAGQGAGRVVALAARLDRGLADMSTSTTEGSGTHCARPRRSSPAARSCRTSRSGRTRARSRAPCTAPRATSG